MSHCSPRHPWLATVAILAVSVLTLASCGDDQKDQEGGPSYATSPALGAALKIGGLMSFTGDFSKFGEPTFDGAELAVSEINSSGGVLGNPVQLVRADDGTSPQWGVNEARRLVDVEKVQAIIGALASGVAAQVADTVTGPDSILQISPASPELTATNDNNFLFRTTMSDAAQGLVLARLANDAAFSEVCTMFINTEYGRQLSNAFATEFQALGGTVTDQVPHESGQATYANELQRCKGTQALAAIAYPETAGVFLREAIEQSITDEFLFVDGTKSDTMLDQLGWDNFDGTKGTSPSDLPTQPLGGFTDRYKAKYGPLPRLPYIKEVYDAVYVIALAAEAAGSTDPTAMRNKLREIANAPGKQFEPGSDNYKQAVAALKEGDDIDYEGVVGPFEFDDKGNPQIGAVEWFHVDAPNKKLVTDKVFRVHLAKKEVTDITDVALANPSQTAGASESPSPSPSSSP
jgi:ABC-type branched-subunit amino acid transport system substrate-binding protein